MSDFFKRLHQRANKLQCIQITKMKDSINSSQEIAQAYNNGFKNGTDNAIQNIINYIERDAEVLIPIN